MSRILVFAEAVTLAHVARPIALSRILRQLGHDVGIASAPAAGRWLADIGAEWITIESIESKQFLHALARGTPVYSLATLKRYVADDLRAIGAWNPDIVIGDFRLSLYISARLAGRPYGAIANACWSRRYWPGVDAPAVSQLSWLPRAIADPMFRFAYPFAFALHALPFRRACDAFGVAHPGLDLRDIYTTSDVTAFADVEAFYEPRVAGGTSPHFIGPLPWEPSGADSLPAMPDGPPIVFVSLGTSGPRALLTTVLQVLAGLPVRCIVATGSGQRAPEMPGHCVHVAEFVPYKPACALASVVVCNGGAPAMYAAITEGCPIIAIPANLDQILNTRAFVRACNGRFPIRYVPARSRLIAETIPMLIAESGRQSSPSHLGPPPATDENVQVARWIDALLATRRSRTDAELDTIEAG